MEYNDTMVTDIESSTINDMYTLINVDKTANVSEIEDTAVNMTSIWPSNDSLDSIEIPRKDIHSSFGTRCKLSLISLNDITSISESQSLFEDVQDNDSFLLPPISTKDMQTKRFFTDILNLTFDPSNFSTSTALDLEHIPVPEIKNRFSIISTSSVFTECKESSQETDVPEKSYATKTGEVNNNQGKDSKNIMTRSSTLNCITPLRFNGIVASPEVSAITNINDTLIDGANLNLLQNLKNSSPGVIPEFKSEQHEINDAKLINPESKPNKIDLLIQQKPKKGSTFKNFVKRKLKCLKDLGKYHGSYDVGRNRCGLTPDVKIIKSDLKAICLAATKPSEIAKNRQNYIKDGSPLSGMLRLSMDCSADILDLKVISGFDMKLNPNFMSDTFVQMSMTSCNNDSEYTWMSPVEHHPSNPKYDRSYSIQLNPEDYRSNLTLTVWQLTDEPLMNIFVGSMSFNISTLLFKNTSGYYRLLPTIIDVVKNLKVAEDHEFRKLTIEYEAGNSNRLGLALVKFQSCMVEYVTTDSIAAKAGLKAGDELIQIDEVNCVSWEKEKISDYLRNSKSSVQLTVRRRLNHDYINNGENL